MKSNTPILFLTFNRLDTTKQVFQKIKEVKPCALYFASDGARLSREGEGEIVQRVRDFVLQNVDWDCEFKTLLQDQNLGCGRAVSSAISWFFEHEEMGIILEDDCLPSLSFFNYCESLLERYRHNTEVTHINGNNFDARSAQKSDYDYHFTYYPQVWGWATWRRAWKNYIYRPLEDHEQLDKSQFNHMNWSQKEFDIQLRKWKSAGGEVDTWDYQWQFVNQLSASYAITPKKNLITNIGEFGTHFSGNTSKLHKKTYELGFPLSHPKKIEIDKKLQKVMKKNMVVKSIFDKILEKFFA